MSGRRLIVCRNLVHDVCLEDKSMEQLEAVMQSAFAEIQAGQKDLAEIAKTPFFTHDRVFEKIVPAVPKDDVCHHNAFLPL